MPEQKVAVEKTSPPLADDVSAAAAAADVSSLPPTHHVLTLRSALRGEAAALSGAAARSANAVLEAVTAQMSRTLLPYADGLVRYSDLRGKVDGADLIQDAWLKVMRYLSGPTGDRVQDDVHLLRLLRVAVRSRLLDLLEKTSVSGGEIALDAAFGWGSDGGGGEGGRDTPAERLVASEGAELLAQLPDPLKWGAGDGRYVRLIEALFLDEKAFRAACTIPPRRKTKHYQAFVLCQLAGYLRAETQGGSTKPVARAAVKEFAALLRAYVAYLGVPADWWERVEAAVWGPGVLSPPAGEPEDEGTDPEIIAAVNVVCGTNIKDRGTIAVLRYEFNQFVQSND